MDPIPPAVLEDLHPHVTDIPKFRRFGHRASRLLKDDYITSPRFILKTSTSDLFKLSFTLQRESPSSQTRQTGSTSRDTPQSPQSFALILTPELRSKDQRFRLKGSFDTFHNVIPKFHFSARDFLATGLKVVYRTQRTGDHSSYGGELQYRHSRGNGVVGLDFEDTRGARLTLSSVLGLTGKNIVQKGVKPDFSIGTEVKCTVPDSVSTRSTLDSFSIGLNYVSHFFDISDTYESVWNGKPYSTRHNLSMLYRHSQATAFAANVSVQDVDLRNLKLTGQSSIELGVKHRYSASTIAKAKLNTESGVVGVSVNHRLSKKVEFTVSTEFQPISITRTSAAPLNVFGLSFTFTP